MVELEHISTLPPEEADKAETKKALEKTPKGAFSVAE